MSCMGIFIKLFIQIETEALSTAPRGQLLMYLKYLTNIEPAIVSNINNSC